MDYHPSSIEEAGPFLRGRQRAVLSTIGPDGGPHQVVVDYALDAEGILLNGRVDRRWVRNLRRDPRASALVHDPADVSHWVRLTGAARLLREGDEEAVEDAMVMARRYGDDPEQFRGQHRVSWRLVPHQVLERIE
ncbi:TIGR03618 family F420-dependent PPOX class oxidoreductase [Acidimicrobiaceae bacterium USS-CC1]|uniref:TIGR03618 family F420-dependent PPOX class oxidoreductase n=1 Tax=Acidiferrimicrobium australe TaxID=2664430 RepID=A0ABW9QQ48_9ACTN|nr:TIGR03618 family F420-dependent PPOX class oxidoreductase [Acidiferrimicrobium australe]